jgi:hypothetical protein
MAQGGIGRSLVREGGKASQLPSTSTRTRGRHVDGLVPAQQTYRSTQIAKFHEPGFEPSQWRTFNSLDFAIRHLQALRFRFLDPLASILP